MPQAEHPAAQGRDNKRDALAVARLYYVDLPLEVACDMILELTEPT